MLDRGLEAMHRGGEEGLRLPPKRMVALSCVLSLFSFVIVFSQTVLNWLMQLSTVDEKVWQNAIRLATVLKAPDGKLDNMSSLSSDAWPTESPSAGE